MNIDALNLSIATTFCTTAASWVKPDGVVALNITFDITPTFEQEGAYAMAGEEITAGCAVTSVAGMQRGHQLIIDSKSYEVLAMHDDGNGWATITLEKA